jgi:hypothetical protein
MAEDWRPMTSLMRILVIAAVLATTGCATVPSAIDDRLYFGRGIPGGGEVSDAQWNAFVAEVVVPRFPEGFTVLRGDGHWKGDDGTSVSEQSWVLEVVHENNPAADTKLAEIAQIYRERFNQDAVMRVRTRAELTFWRRP